MNTKKQFYAYMLPTGEKGIVASWAECEKLVSGVKGARFRGFALRNDAEEWINSGALYGVKKPVEKGIYFDAGTGRGQGVEVRVTNEERESLLADLLPKHYINRHGNHGLMGATNNHGELLACKFALQIALKRGETKIFGDSALIIDYWSKGHVKHEGVSADTVRLAREVAVLRKDFEAAGGILIRISGDDNPADLGFHK